VLALLGAATFIGSIYLFNDTFGRYATSLLLAAALSWNRPAPSLENEKRDKRAAHYPAKSQV